MNTQLVEVTLVLFLFNFEHTLLLALLFLKLTFYGRGSAALWLQSHYEELDYFLPLQPWEFYAITLSPAEQPLGF